MEAPNLSAKKNSLKRWSQISLVVLLLYIILQLVQIYQTRYQLVSPLIPESVIWELNKQFVFTALIVSIAAVVAMILYFFEKHLVVIILAGLMLLASRYIYVGS